MSLALYKLSRRGQEAKDLMRKNELDKLNSLPILGIGYVANLIPFAGIERVTFLYHYLPSLIFSILIASVLLGKICRRRRLAFAVLFGLVLVGFLVVIPFTFGIVLRGCPIEVK
jgi:dolichyl-phosphate-mannose--protein O-mannosyl transferase